MKLFVYSFVLVITNAMHKLCKKHITVTFTLHSSISCALKAHKQEAKANKKQNSENEVQAIQGGINSLGTQIRELARTETS